MEVTEWKESTFATYVGKDQLSEFLSETSPHIYEISKTIGLSEIDFQKRLSQSKHRRELGHNCSSKFSKALLRKSRDNMLLAIELYNRPSLENRMDGFVLCFCTAWENLLKSILIEKSGEESIFKSSSRESSGVRETISLRDCLSKLYKKDNLVRRNVEKIAYYRDQAIHLLMPEVQGLLSKVFQSGVINFSLKFSEFSEQSFLPAGHSGLLSIVGNISIPSTIALGNNYGQEIGSEMSSLIAEVEREIEDANSIEFAIPLTVEFSFVRKDNQGNPIELVRADEGIEGLRKAMVINKPMDRSKTHPYREKDAIIAINSRLSESYSPKDLEKELVFRDKATNQVCVGQHCFRAVLHKLKWKNSNNRHHYMDTDPESHHYSSEAVDDFVKKIMDNHGYLRKAREDYSVHLKQRRRGGKERAK